MKLKGLALDDALKPRGESSQTEKIAYEVNRRDKDEGRTRENLRSIVSLEPELLMYDDMMLEAEANMDVTDDEPTDTYEEKFQELFGFFARTILDYLLKKSNPHTRSEFLVKIATCHIHEDPLEEPKEMTTTRDDLLKKSDSVDAVDDPVDAAVDTYTLPLQQLHRQHSHLLKE
ncbi:hypothetical protein Tco_0237957 [Tanacetum coccineum]